MPPRPGWAGPLPEGLDEEELQARLFGPARPGEQRQPLPEMSQVHQQLKGKGVTLRLVWEEYRAVYPDGYGYTQFCAYYRRWQRTLDPPLRQVHPAGEKLFVDWAGATIPWKETATGQGQEAVLFVAVLGASNYTFAQAFAHQRLESWIEAHVQALTFFGGVPQVVVPDNPKTGVVRPCWYEPQLHPTYAEWAAHYGTVVLPARPYAPRDKAKVESGVQHAQRRLVAPLRHQTFFSVGQINQALRPLVHQLNQAPFQKLSGSRHQLFVQLDQPVLQPLPTLPYQLGTWRTAKVNIDYHVQVDWHNYSVPYTLIHQSVEVRLSAQLVELFHKGLRVAVHARSHQRSGFTTEAAHRPKAHQKHLQWTPSRLIEWAQTLGPACGQLVTTLLAHKPHPEQGYRACLGILRLAKGYGPERLESACQHAVALDSCTYRTVASLLKTNRDQLPLPTIQPSTPTPAPTHDNVRGPDYYLPSSDPNPGA